MKIFLFLRAWFWEWVSFKRWERMRALRVENGETSRANYLERSANAADQLSKNAWEMFRGEE